MADSIFSTRLTPEKIAGTDNVYSIPMLIRGYSNGISPE